MSTGAPLDVLLVGINYGPESTGIAPYTQGMAEGLRDRGHRVRVVTSYPSYPAWRVDPGFDGWTRRETIAGVPVTRLRTYVPAEPTPVKRVAMEGLFGLRAAVHAGGPADAVVAVSPALISSTVVETVRRLLPGRRRSVGGLWIQDLYGLGLRETGVGESPAARAIAAAERSLVNRVDGVAVIHERFRDHLVGELGVDADRVSVVPNWSHIAFPDASDGERARRERGWSPDETVVLHAGNMGVKQGLESVVAAARLAESRGLPLRFVLLGDGNQRAALERAAEGCARLEFVPPVAEEQFPAVLAAADVLLLNELPSLAEMCVPSKLTSYFAAGRPVLAATSGQGVSAGVVERSGGGVVVEPGDPAALVDAAQLLGQDAAARDRLGSRGREFCRSTMSASGSIDEFERWLHRMVHTNTPVEGV